MTLDLDYSKTKLLVLITGGGRGFGQSCALSLAERLGDGSVMLLCGRNMENLQETEEKIKKKEYQKNLTLHSFVLDQSHLREAELRVTLVSLVSHCSCTDSLIVHNAGSIGDVTKRAYEWCDSESVTEYFGLNLAGMIALNGIWASMLPPSVQRSFVVNVSSLMAVQPFGTCSLYCSGKVAREMFLSCLVKDWKATCTTTANREFFAISYAPGPLKTDMMTYLLTELGDAELKSSLNKAQADGILLEPIVSADRLFDQVLARFRQFQNGGRVDYYDLDPIDTVNKF